MFKNIKPLVYAVKHKNGDVIKNSSSGGAFTALSDVFLKEGNAVASCIYNYRNDRVEFRIYDDVETRNLARGSKYIQANIDDGFKKLVVWLNDNPNRNLLVVGSGCQMEGLRLLLEFKKLRERAILVDFICHGATSSGLWQEYIKNKGIKGKIDFLCFKDKRVNWHNPTAFAKVKGKEVSIKDFSEWFYGGWAIRESCYDCPFTKINRNTDITIGDFWGIENVIPDFADPMGVSLMIIQSERGYSLFEKIKDSIIFRECSQQDCLQPRLKSPPDCPKDRELFWHDIQMKGLEYCSRNYKEVVPEYFFCHCFIKKVKSIARKLFHSSWFKKL
ncbi:Coenzyme F420 hydrogenase/dehydrogenase, beta subunit C-terminal domain [Succinivibrio faecicola]|uniref:Coenzyme F420 hydrogenase/dehydrogenase, beta subunit C-terminal domain n=1 Tax=Succinivibrio faecicola TaxID=2820300 RepID=A0ABS7DIF9_9GAMM|nr:Coenzyme F420 hydrogenase/dehydrogenase, beta subunit C-terminal domain [Succinivibrio faecicola]MBW7571090.1 Coenzyme F420 hydrogenase/dehydrogenase, beta subunit C-terminal domain [Succinivibrio faecicola]